MLLVMAAIGGTDILFALDSIPAIFGLTQNVFLVFTATAFSLLGLRQLYFLIDGLLDRLVYLSYGLAVILAFIGVKLILHALHENNVPFINEGQPVNVVEVSTGLSLAVIIGVLVVTVIASLTSPKGRAQNLVSAARRHATEYLMCETDPAVREDVFQKLLDEETHMRRLPEKYRARIREEEQLMELLRRAHAEHEAHAVGRPPPPGRRSADVAGAAGQTRTSRQASSGQGEERMPRFRADGEHRRRRGHRVGREEAPPVDSQPMIAGVPSLDQDRMPNRELGRRHRTGVRLVVRPPCCLAAGSRTGPYEHSVALTRDAGGGGHGACAACCRGAAPGGAMRCRASASSARSTPSSWSKTWRRMLARWVGQACCRRASPRSVRTA